ncbi:asparagine synthase (glutamine-hydrolyzing) [uncultured Chloroflexus sp.]|uniref:asparagine synthase (glutamine-hydrolyzing) n=1 Tax=uncultured Chloroflexus sp. TaxID=214040 RepID=UPI00261133FE|nr:asparagine synthase (glutamine-hydrolyzing) [uncultured Chloroflexus sp.]
MCGIAGIVASEVDLEIVRKMLQAMSHRGPDDTGLEKIQAYSRCAVFGAVRLAIIDLSPAGHMPMIDETTGNIIVFNGEIYNFRELRSKLEALGETFCSSTDTEVALKAYKHWGSHCLQLFRGMFAFAIWDAGRKELFLARDRFGEKPLYYARFSSQGFIFASEVRALLASGLLPHRLNPDAVKNFLWNGFTVAPQTIVAGVRSLLPGHWIRVKSDGAIEENCYWRLPSSRQESSSANLVELLTELEMAVKLRLVSDVPLGIFLSGGLDSSAVTALASRCQREIRTLSVAFEEADYDESVFARRVANNYGAHYEAILLSRQLFSGWIQDSVAAMDQPTFDGVNTYVISRATKQAGLTVALSGIGGDELFGGYPHFRTMLMARKLLSIARRLQPGLSHILATLPGSASGLGKLFALVKVIMRKIPNDSKMLSIAAYQATQLQFPPDLQQQLLQPDFADATTMNSGSWFGLPSEFVSFISSELYPSDDDLTTISRLSSRLFLGERCLRDADSMSMSVSLEVRPIFTDHVFVETAYKIPGSIRCQGAPDKPFQYDMLRSRLGESYTYRRKQGFMLPFKKWLRKPEILEIIKDTLTDQITVTMAGLNPIAVQKVMDAFEAKRIPWSRLWLLFVLCRWCRQNGVQAV